MVVHIDPSDKNLRVHGKSLSCGVGATPVLGKI